MPGLEDEDEFSDDYPRHFGDLSPEEKQILGNLTPEAIRSCEVTHDWYDDHQICVSVVLNDIAFGAWWCGWEVAGAFKYWDSPTAKAEICNYLKQSVTDAIEDDHAEDQDEQRELEAQDSIEDPDEITLEDLPQGP